jgi:hypothetical protein
MRTTLTLDPDVVRILEEEVHRTRRPFKQVVNDAIRRGLAPRGRAGAPTAYRLRPHPSSLQPGLDEGRLNQLADELEQDAALRKHGAQR